MPDRITGFFSWPHRLPAVWEPAAPGDYGKIFDTYWFLGFAGVVIPIFWVLRRPEWRQPFLALACVVFHYHFAGPAGMFPIIVIGSVTYLLGLTRNRMACSVGMGLSIAALGLYKYTHFLSTEVLAQMNPRWGLPLEQSVSRVLSAAPPLAISFFAFEFIHYLYEVRRGAAPIRHPLRFLLFAIFFPSLVAGPIKRYGQFIPALEAGTTGVGVDDVSLGLRRVAMGLVKKMVVADNLSLAINFYSPGDKFASLTLAARWLVFVLIALRILFDFSGYSDIAIGLARMMGIKLPENFNWPYAATNLREFWQRWHISLSSWIRDYVYIPLGGNRHGLARKMLNGLMAFAVIGLWHGAAWHFVLWGLYHGVGLAVSANYAAVPGAGPRLAGWLTGKPAVGWIGTQLFAWFGWLIFFFPVAQAGRMAGLLFNLGS